jgi:lysophospholipase L1-like esterase
MKIRYFYALAALLFLVACEPKISEPVMSSGSADFSKYVALGNSLTSGYADGALYKSAQANSYPAILATQFAKVGGGNFVQPMVDNEDGLLAGKRILGYSTDCKGLTSLSPVLAGGSPTGIPGALAPVGYSVNNFGVPGAKTLHLLAPGYGNAAGLLTVPPTANPYFVRFASSTATSVLADAMAASPTFFTLWIGNNDVLGYALAGGENNTVGEVCTPAATLNFGYETLITTLTSGGAKGAIANIPDITSIPYFNTVPYNGLYLTAEQAAQLDGAYRLTELAIQGMGLTGFTYDIHFAAGYNGFVVEDRESALPLPGYLKVRQLKPGELVLLSVPQDALKCEGMGSFDIANQKPYGIPQNYILDAGEIQNIQNTTAAMNTKIKALADAKGLAFVDVAEKLITAKTGLVFDGLKLNTKFVTGGLFSLDGVHMNAQGAAIVANYFVDAINAKYGASIPKAEVTSYPGILFP